jgi:hypothetical protein
MWACWVVYFGRDENGWEQSYASPTFFLDVSVQDIRDAEHATAIVEKIINQKRSDTCYIHVNFVG